jgi:hypothetical protein
LQLIGGSVGTGIGEFAARICIEPPASSKPAIITKRIAFLRILPPLEQFGCWFKTAVI